MKTHLARNALPAAAARYFPRPARDFFHEPGFFDALVQEWHACLVEDGDNAFLNCFARSPVPGTAHYDINPFMGYAGPLVAAADPAFLARALGSYSQACRELGIVAEIMRIHPLLGHAPQLLAQPALRHVAQKEIIIVPCCESDASQLAQVTPACRRRIEAGTRNFSFRALLPGELAEFYALYRTSMARANADPVWFFPDAALAALALHPDCAVYGVFQDSDLLAAVLVAHHQTASHYMLACARGDYPKGAGDFLVFGATRAAATRGARHFVLGGGIGAAPDDPLLRFKKKFAQETSHFHLLGMVHNETVFAQLVADAVARDPTLAPRPYFLKYRLAQEKSA